VGEAAPGVMVMGVVERVRPREGSGGCAGSARASAEAGGGCVEGARPSALPSAYTPPPIPKD